VKSYVNSKLVLEDCPIMLSLLWWKYQAYLVLHMGYFYVLNLKNLGNNEFILFTKFLLIFFWLFMRNKWRFLMAKRKNLIIVINFYIMCSPYWWEMQYMRSYISIWGEERKHFMNNIFQSPSRKSSFPDFILYGAYGIPYWYTYCD